MKEKTALVTAIGSFSADCVLETLRRLDYRIVGTDIYPEEWLPASLKLDAFCRLPPAAEEEDYLFSFRKLLERERPEKILPLIDLEVDLLNLHREELETENGIFCICGKEEIELLRDKYLLARKVAGSLNELEDSSCRANVRAIRTEYASELDFEALSFPLVLKPVNGRSSGGLYRIHNEDELGFSLSVILREGGEERLSSYIAQPLIRGRVVTVDILRDRFGNTASIPREELLRTPNGAGLSVRVFQDRNFQRVCEYLAERLNILGCVNFEFIRGEGSGVYYFVECNPRFSGGVAFTELSGFPAVEESLRIFDGERLRTDYPLRYGYFTRKYTECRMKR